MNDASVKIICRKSKIRQKISTVYKKFIKNFAQTLDKGGEKGYIISVG